MEKQILTDLGFKEIENETPEDGFHVFAYTAQHGGILAVNVSLNGWVKHWRNVTLHKELAEVLKEKFPTQHSFEPFYEALQYFLEGGEIERAVKMFETFNTNEAERVMRSRE